jgi:integrase
MAAGAHASQIHFSNSPHSQRYAARRLHFFRAAGRALPLFPCPSKRGNGGLLILTGMRSEAVRWARFEEFDLAASVWTTPQRRMKVLDRDQRIPLGPRAVEIVRDLCDNNDSNLVFAAVSGDRPIGRNEAAKLLPQLLKAIGYNVHVVAHGFRSAFKDWVHETRDYPAEVIEQALGHRIKSSVERAYRRGDLFDRRRLLMLDWESYCNGGEASSEVIPLRA